MLLPVNRTQIEKNFGLYAAAAGRVLRELSVLLPAGTPGAYVNRIQSEVARAVKDPVVRQRLEEQGLEGVGSTTEEFAKVIEDEFALNRKLTAIMGIVPQ